MENTLENALKLASQGVPVYPLATNSKVPLKGTHGYKDATTDTEQITAWFNNNQQLNVGLALSPALLLVIDLDRQHASGYDGITAFNQLNKRYGNRTENPLHTYALKTPRDGIHLFYKLPDSVNIPSKPLASFSQQLRDYKGIDVITTGTPAPLTATGNGRYETIAGTGVTNIGDAIKCPEWLLSLLTSEPKQTPKYNSPTRKTWAGEILESVFEPSAETGNRNVYLTSVCGRLLRTGSDPSVVYEALETANSHLPTPLPDKEVNQIFKSILRKELSR
jgi:hypothetical protein